MTKPAGANYEALKHRTLAAMHEKLYPLWSQREKALYNSKYKKSVSFANTTLPVQSHKTIWGQWDLDSLCRHRRIKYHLPHLEHFPAGPLVELPEPVRTRPRLFKRTGATKDTGKDLNNRVEGPAALGTTVEDLTSTAPNEQSEASATKNAEPGMVEGQAANEGSCNNDSGSGYMNCPSRTPIVGSDSTSMSQDNIAGIGAELKVMGVNYRPMLLMMKEPEGDSVTLSEHITKPVDATCGPKSRPAKQLKEQIDKMVEEGDDLKGIVSMVVSCVDSIWIKYAEKCIECEELRDAATMKAS